MGVVDGGSDVLGDVRVVAEIKKIQFFTLTNSFFNQLSLVASVVVGPVPIGSVVGASVLDVVGRIVVVVVVVVGITMSLIFAEDITEITGGGYYVKRERIFLNVFL